MPFPGSIELDSDLPVVRNFFDGLLPGHMIVRFDQRGTGASQRDVDDISVEAQTGDLAAVVDALGLERFELFAGPGLPAHAAVTYCARTPDRVQHLILWEAAPAIRKVDGPVAEAERVLIRENWRGASRTLSDNIAPRAPVDIKKALTNIYRETLAADMVIRLWDEESDITAVLPHLAARCLVLHVRDDRQVPLAVAIQRDVAKREGLSVHIGLNAGEPVAEDDDLFGTSVQLARRICDQAEGGEILASDVVRQLVAGKGFLFADRGETALRGFEDPVRIYEVRWQG